jgi:hypothetical protein
VGISYHLNIEYRASIHTMAVTIDSGPHDGPDTIGPEHSPKRSFGERVNHLVKAFTTKEGLVGNYDYGMFIYLSAPISFPPPQSPKEQLLTCNPNSLPLQTQPPVPQEIQTSRPLLRPPRPHARTPRPTPRIPARPSYASWRHLATYHHRGLSQLRCRHIAVSRIDITDCLWNSIRHPDYSLPHLQNSLLYRNRTDFSCGHFLCDYSNRN